MPYATDYAGLEQPHSLVYRVESKRAAAGSLWLKEEEEESRARGGCTNEIRLKYICCHSC